MNLILIQTFKFIIKYFVNTCKRKTEPLKFNIGLLQIGNAKLGFIKRVL